MPMERPAERNPRHPAPPRQWLPIVVLLLSVGACAAMPPPADPIPPQTAGQCNAEAARSAVGKAPTAEVVERARVDSGSAHVRVIRPGQAVTMDYRVDRVNLDVNEREAITAVRCG